MLKGNFSIELQTQAQQNSVELSNARNHVNKPSCARLIIHEIKFKPASNGLKLWHNSFYLHNLCWTRCIRRGNLELTILLKWFGIKCSLILHFIKPGGKRLFRKKNLLITSYHLLFGSKQAGQLSVEGISESWNVWRNILAAIVGIILIL